ncbi:MAG: hypothetical protein AAF298_15460 [Cyanobacteria bacterium P01_A01_bin.40]
MNKNTLTIKTPFDGEIFQDNGDVNILRGERNIKIALEDEDGDEVFSFNKPQALLNIFDEQYYLETNPDVAEAVEGLYEDARISSFLFDAEFKLFPPISTNADENDNVITENLGNSVVTIKTTPDESQDQNIQVSEYVASIEHYLNSGAIEGRNPSPLFDTDYYVEQNPDVATALVGGNFEGDPLLHYVSVGAGEGRNPNAYFDTDYYVEQNPDVVERDLNPLEHYVLIGSLTGADPSTSFDSSFYLSENPDVAAAGVDPLTHYLTFGQEEGRLTTA